MRKVPDAALLQVDTISCVASSGNDFFLLRSSKIDVGHIIGVAKFPTLNGPLYFLAGETPTLAMGGSATDTLKCFVSATLWHTS